MIDELDRIALAVDLSEHSLRAGDIGLVHHIYSDHQAYVVEFVDFGGDLIALVTLNPDQVRRLDVASIPSIRRIG